MSFRSSRTQRPEHEYFQSIQQLPNGFQINQYFQRYIKTEFILGGALMVNIFIIVSYDQCEFKMKESEQKQWFLHAGFYYALFCIILLLANTTANYDYRILIQSVDIPRTIFNLLLKIFILLLRPYPFLENVDIEFSSQGKSQGFQLQIHPLNNILALLSFMQSFIVFQTFFNTSKLKNDRSDRVCGMYGLHASNMFVIKAWFKKNYLLKLLAIFFIWSLICTECFRITEYHYNHRIQFIENAFWLSFNSMFCIGFGDVVPKTKIGNWISFIAMYTGVILIYFSITEIQNFLSLNSPLTISLEKKNQLKLVASQYLRESLWRVWKNRQNREYGIYFNPTLKQTQLRKKMKKVRHEARNNRHVNTVYDEFLQQFQRTQGYIASLKDNNDQLIYGLLDSFNKTEMKKIMSKRGTFYQPQQTESKEDPWNFQTIKTIQSVQFLED